MFKGAVMDDPVIHARTKGIGVLTKEQAKAYCVVGPTARPSGIAIDVRKDDPYFAYDWIDWNIIVLEEGEVVGKGTHHELMKICQTYQEIASSQLSKEELA